VKRWQQRWLLDHWRLFIVFENGKMDEKETAASCAASTRYLQATIRIWSPFWDRDMNNDGRERVICHEIAHIHTWELAELAAHARRGQLVTQEEQDRVDERTTEHIARALFSAWGG
jgi:hypothetical protein